MCLDPGLLNRLRFWQSQYCAWSFYKTVINWEVHFGNGNNAGTHMGAFADASAAPVHSFIPSARPSRPGRRYLPLAGHLPLQAPSLMSLAHSLIQPESLAEHHWDEETLYVDSWRYVQDIFAAIDAAREHIMFATYIFELDEVGEALIARLKQARARGVNVQVLFDGVGAMTSGDKIAKELSASGVGVKIFHPLPWQPDSFQYSLQPSFRLSRWPISVLKINQRYHGKLCIVDRNILFCGSQNMCVDHLPVAHGGKGWHDFGARVTGSSVGAVASMFDDLWAFRRPKLGQGIFKFYLNNLSTYARRRKHHLLKNKFARAQRRIWIINSYFSPTRSILRELRRAGQRGVDVRIIVPNKSDIQFFPLLTATYYEELIRNGVRVFEYLPSILHAKAQLVDDFFVIGSTNFNHRSILHDVEFDIVLNQLTTLRTMEEYFEKDLQQSREIQLSDLKLFGARRLLGWIPWLIRYWV